MYQAQRRDARGVRSASTRARCYARMLIARHAARAAADMMRLIYGERRAYSAIADLLPVLFSLILYYDAFHFDASPMPFIRYAC